MECLNMLNNDQQSHRTSSNINIPRISFSNDFADAQKVIVGNENCYREPPVSSSDFEFSVSSYGMISADELIFKGKLVPVKEQCYTKTTTLREELLVEDELMLRSPKERGSAGWWKERLGLKRAQIAPKKADASEDLYANKDRS